MTLFLDEIGDIPLELQPKLLRVLQEQEFERLGSAHTRHVDVRVVAATNRNLTELIAEKQFRVDLFYRLNVFPISVPPLRRRAEDIPILVAHFARMYGERMSKQISAIPRDAMKALTHYSWPGNIRELQNFMERAVIMTPGDVLQTPPLPPGLETRSTHTLASVEREQILKALAESRGSWVADRVRLLGWALSEPPCSTECGDAG